MADEGNLTVWVSCCWLALRLSLYRPQFNLRSLTSFVFPRHLPPSHRALPSSTTATATTTSPR